ncbi:MAG: tRNA (adenosine(37)-N6)-threonylcarbamoyltransferase complex ATPase subunit type 1 TsaE [Rickettsiales bacterium]|jgi:tRNA threonylcarbamoyladenosine biosynthesis protein TsaE|nr:tRNA (adenosine(37)-N6)-threonylcarbamoyltransferase complex ATPase subunit type 1 TsaE [Rickettsiales bacterium]
MYYEVNSVDETQKIASAIADQFKIGDVVLLNGVLGAGKTYFISCIIRHILGDNTINVTSPTFNLVKEYICKDYTIYHFDLYRLKQSKELYELGIEDAFENGISFIEWGEKARESIYNVKWIIDIKIINNNSRSFTIKKL